VDTFTGGTAVVTGGGSGIGRGLALTWAAEGMNVVVADIEPAGAKEVAEEVRRFGVGALAIECDVSKQDAVNGLADAAYGEFGEVNMLCNNAGVLLHRPLIECTLDDWHWIFGVNVFGVVHGVDAFLPRMLAQRGPGHIVNMGSGTGIYGGRPTGPDPSHLGIYYASKHAIVSYTEQLAAALFGSDIGVSVVIPNTGVKTRMADAERNRPIELGAPASKVEAKEQMAEHLAVGMDPVRVGEITRDGVRRNQLYIVTHYLRDPLLHRFAGILEDFAFAPGGPHARRPSPVGALEE
jgi:NAD(P)-dependent dehydrogenase (short-subunit alcohol dehydrogenase family)